MTSITFAVDEEFKPRLSKFSWINLSELVKLTLLLRIKKFEELKKRLESPEEQEIIRWSVELGRKAKKDSFKRLLSEISPEVRGRLLKKLSSEKREEYK
jgi:hypothetical protein